MKINVFNKVRTFNLILGLLLILFTYDIVRWGLRACLTQNIVPTPPNLRQILQDILPLIRFPQMSQKDFEDFVVPIQILNFDELNFLTKWRQFLSKAG